MAILDYKKLMLVGLRGEKGEKGDRGEKGERGDAGNQEMLDRMQADIKDLYLIANATVTGTEEVEHAYTERQTANGLSGLIDGALTRVTKIQGSTIKSKNIFNRYYAPPSGRCSVLEITDEKIVVSLDVAGTYFSINFRIENPEQYIGKTLYMSAKWTCSGNNKGAIRVMWFNGDAAIGEGMVKESAISGVVASGVVPEKPEGADNLRVLLYGNLSGSGVSVGDTVTYTDIMVSTENVPYTPYFSGLKHAFIDSIKSIGRNIIDFNTIAEEVVRQTTQSEIVTFDGKRCLKYLDIGNSSIKTVFPSGIIRGLRFKAYVDGAWFTSFASCELSNGTTTYMGVNETQGNQWIEFSRYYTDKTIESFTFYAYNVQSNAPVYIDLDSIMLEQSTTPTEHEPYKENTYQLPTPVELPAYDSILPQEDKIVRATDTRVIDGTTVKVEKSVDLGEWQLYTYTPAEKLPCVYGSQVVPIGWGNDTPANSPGFIKGVYLTNSGSITIGVWFNKAKFLEETGVDVVNSPAAVNEYFAHNPLTVCRQLQNPIETAETLPETYPVCGKGIERIVQGDTDNSIYGAMPTVKQTYVLIKGV